MVAELYALIFVTTLIPYEPMMESFKPFNGHSEANLWPERRCDP